MDLVKIPLQDGYVKVINYNHEGVFITVDSTGRGSAILNKTQLHELIMTLLQAQGEIE